MLTAESVTKRDFGTKAGNGGSSLAPRRERQRRTTWDGFTFYVGTFVLTSRQELNDVPSKPVLLTLLDTPVSIHVKNDENVVNPLHCDGITNEEDAVNKEKRKKEQVFRGKKTFSELNKWTVLRRHQSHPGTEIG